MKLVRSIGMLLCLGGALVFAPACGAGEDGDGIIWGGSCTDYGGAAECLEYTGSEWHDTDARYHCQMLQGTYGTGDCPTEGEVGRCALNSGETLEYFHVYYGQVSEAAASCASNNGVWEAA